LGFPSFYATNRALHDALLAATAAPLRDHTNEQVALALFEVARVIAEDAVEIKKWGHTFRLARLELAVRGVRDNIGHSDGFTTYIIEDDGQ
jgi:hypothetical protein